MARNGERAKGRPSENNSTLELLGVEPKQSHQWQKLAEADQGDFEQYIADAKESGAAISTNAALRYLTPAETGS